MKSTLRIIIGVIFLGLVYIFSHYYLAPAIFTKYTAKHLTLAVDKANEANRQQAQIADPYSNRLAEKTKWKIRSNQKRISKCYVLLTDLAVFRSRKESMERISELRFLVDRILVEESLIKDQVAELEKKKAPIIKMSKNKTRQ